MQPEQIFFPIIGMAFLTLTIGLRMLKLRIKAVKEGAINPAYFRLNRGGKLPEYLAKSTQHYDNLFEMPILFYVVVVLVYVTGHVDPIYLVSAWLFLIARVVHAVIHVTYNNVQHRRNAFLMGTLVLYGIWGRLFFQLLSS